jgi:23S rRNA (cytidine1920-2'-O)/16S rRNA (cytidine1409-2'-O)-methyltransferase
MKKIRLDTYLVEHGYFDNAAAALRAIMAREVKVDDVYATSAAQPVDERASVWVRGRKRFVSRGGDKLQGALDAFNINAEGKSCLDIGSSTGGFSDCLLQAGAARVACVDVNYGQLAWEVRTNPRVAVYERTNIKLADPLELGGPFDIVVIDVSFIGLASLAPTIAKMCKLGATFLGLIKPQFEAQASEVCGGVVRDADVRERVVSEVKEALGQVGFEVRGVIPSPIKGAKSHNTEYLIWATYK